MNEQTSSTSNQVEQTNGITLPVVTVGDVVPVGQTGLPVSELVNKVLRPEAAETDRLVLNAITSLTENVAKLGKRLDSQLASFFTLTERIQAVETAVDHNPVTVRVRDLTQEQLDSLYRPLPSEAITQPSAATKGLCSIKAIYAVERLNNVFGICGRDWLVTSEHITTLPKSPDNKKGAMVVLKVHLDIPAYNIHMESYGGNDNADAGDAYKGAVTDALTKMASWLGIGIDVFKGLGDGPSKEYEQERAQIEIEEARKVAEAAAAEKAEKAKIAAESKARAKELKDKQLAAAKVAAGEKATDTPTAKSAATATAGSSLEPDETSDNRTIGVSCEDCQELVYGFSSPKGVYPAEQVVARGQEKHKLNLCVLCLRKRKAEADQNGGGKAN